MLTPLASQRSLWLRCARHASPSGLMVRAIFVALVCTAVQALAEIELTSSPGEQLVIGADNARRWTEGVYDVWLFNGNCYVNQGLNYCRAEQAVVWVKRGDPLGDPTNKVIAYLEGNVRIDATGAGRADGKKASTGSDQGWLGRFHSTAPVKIDVAASGAEPEVKPAVYRNAMAKRDPRASQGFHRTQFTESSGDAPPAAPPVGTRRLRVFRRSGVDFQFQWIPNPARNEGVAVISNGVNLIIDGLENVGQLDISTDNMVIWTAGSLDKAAGETLQDKNVPLEIYMEGNIIFRQGDREIYADRMYYDVQHKIGTVLNAEVLMPVNFARRVGPAYQGFARLKADVIQQTGEDRFFAHNSFITSSRMSRPGYRLRARDIYFEDNQQLLLNPLTGTPEINPATGEPAVHHERVLTSDNNFLFLGPVPVFYCPRFTTDLEEPSLLIRSAELQNDRIFGTWADLRLDTFQLLGMRRPKGTDWIVRIDELTRRGFGGGTRFRYNRAEFLGIPGPTVGMLDAWALRDHSTDILGRGRFNLRPEQDFRYRVLGQHRQLIAGEYQLTAELGLVSDRNFLEQYFESDWDQKKDETTGFELKRAIDNMSYSLTADVRVNAFFMQTNWLPRLDHFWLGQPLIDDTFSWYEHSQAGYPELRTASTPKDPQDAANFKLLPWETNAGGGRFVTRQEIDLPVQLGPVMMVPYAQGEIAHWGEDLSGNKVDRVFGQVGMRASVPFWTADPTVENSLFNVHGIAHKVVVDVDASVADANRDLTRFPLYDPLDDDAQEHFRRRFAFITYGGTTPTKFDERFYALRSGLQSWVTSPSTEIADDLAAIRMGVRQRWQTKRGPPGSRRIIDWIVLDTEAVFFPNPGRDNFGDNVGLLDYNFRWHIGDRTTLLSSGIFDFFDLGQRNVNIGIQLSRPPRANWYVGLRSLGGPLNYHVVNSSYSYRLSPKWVSSANTSFALVRNGNIGQSFALIRVGESLLTSFAFNVDSAKHNVGAMFMIEPRFGTRTRLGRIGGQPIPVAGLYGLE